MTATVDFDPNAFNMKSEGQWITAYIQLPKEYNPEDINPATILLNNTISPILDPKYDFVHNPSEYLTDNNEDGILERMVKFDRADVKALIKNYLCQSGWRFSDVTLTATGNLFKGTPIEGSTTIRVIVGDVNQDNVVDTSDLTEVATAYGTFEHEPAYNWYADINEDGIVDTLDLSLVATHLE